MSIRKFLGLPSALGLLVGVAGITVGGGALLALSATHATAAPLGYAVYVGYGDDVHATPSFPVPWFGDAGVTWEGCSGGCASTDAGAVRIVNSGDASGLTINSVSVNVDGCIYDNSNMGWGTNVSNAFEGSVIYTQTTSGASSGCPGDGTMDTSDVPYAGHDCGGNDGAIPTVTVTATDSSGTDVVTTFNDTGQVLNTGGTDPGSCTGASEATQWTPIGSAPCATGAVLTLSPSSQTKLVTTTATLTANLSACGTPLPGATVNFDVLSGPNSGLSGTGTAPTDSSGNSSFAYSSTLTGTDTLQASVTTAVGSITSNTATVTWILPFAPGGGAFVIGDGNSAVGTHVTFWGAQWSKDNTLSGGAAPKAFKGYALNPTTPTCKSVWTTDPGNSAPPPPGPLPKYMGIIVTSKSGKVGSTIMGNIVQIVVVQTNSGYQPDPGHPGTGTVVGVVC